MPHNNTPTQTFIAGCGEADIHAAREAELPVEELAKQKFAWFIAHHEKDDEGIQKMLKRFLTYQQRADDAQKQWMDAEVATPRAIHYNYRYSYYVELVQRIRIHFACVLNCGYKAIDGTV